MINDEDQVMRSIRGNVEYLFDASTPTSYDGDRFFHQTTVSRVVFFMVLDVIVKVVNFPSQNSDLNFW